MSILTNSGTTIFEQQLGPQLIDPQLLQTISTIALGFKNTIDIALNSINYLDYRIYFRRGENFLAVVLSNDDSHVDGLIDKMFSELMDQKILANFIEFANLDLICDNTEIVDSIRKIMVNLDFMMSLSDFKAELKEGSPRF